MQELLEVCGRSHGLYDAYAAIEAMHAAGPPSWSLDLMSGCAGACLFWPVDQAAAVSSTCASTRLLMHPHSLPSYLLLSAGSGLCVFYHLYSSSFAEPQGICCIARCDVTGCSASRHSTPAHHGHLL